MASIVINNQRILSEKLAEIDCDRVAVAAFIVPSNGGRFNVPILIALYGSLDTISTGTTRAAPSIITTESTT